ncbi:MAG: T9SS type A sorting domain-containing protein [Saprospiraceae bacterium]
MKVALTLFLAAITSHLAFGQNDYQLFRQGVQYIYESTIDAPTNSRFLGVKVADETCTTLYEGLHHLVEPDSGLLCAQRKPSFAGSEVCHYPDSTLINIGTADQPVIFTLLQTSLLGSQWFLGEWLIDGEMTALMARIDTVQEKTFLGITDSVKYIGLYRQLPNGNLAPANPSATPIAVSKQYGLISTPYLPALLEDGDVLTLAGISNPTAGIQDVSREACFNQQIGDELHVQKLNTVLSTSSYKHVHTTEHLVLTKQWWNIDHTVLYQEFEVMRKIWEDGPDATSDTLFQTEIKDTLVHQYTMLDWLDQQPSSILFEPGDVYSAIDLNTTTLCEITSKYYRYPVYDAGVECALELIDASQGVAYANRAGGPYYNHVGLGGYFVRELKFLKLNDGTVCGTPLDITVNDTAPLPENSFLHVWPNPAREKLYLSTADGVGWQQVKLYPITGQSLQLMPAVAHDGSVDISQLPVGMYSLLATDVKGNIHQARFVKH